MSEKEKIISIFFIISFFLVIISAIFTIWQLRPESGFLIEQFIKNLAIKL